MLQECNSALGMRLSIRPGPPELGQQDGFNLGCTLRPRHPLYRQPGAPRRVGEPRRVAGLWATSQHACCAVLAAVLAAPRTLQGRRRSTAGIAAPEMTVPAIARPVHWRKRRPVQQFLNMVAGHPMRYPRRHAHTASLQPKGTRQGRQCTAACSNGGAAPHQPLRRVVGLGLGWVLRWASAGGGCGDAPRWRGHVAHSRNTGIVYSSSVFRQQPSSAAASRSRALVALRHSHLVNNGLLAQDAPKTAERLELALGRPYGAGLRRPMEQARACQRATGRPAQPPAWLVDAIAGDRFECASDDEERENALSPGCLPNSSGRRLRGGAAAELQAAAAARGRTAPRAAHPAGHQQRQCCRQSTGFCCAAQPTSTCNQPGRQAGWRRAGSAGGQPWGGGLHPIWWRGGAAGRRSASAIIIREHSLC